METTLPFKYSRANRTGDESTHGKCLMCPATGGNPGHIWRSAILGAILFFLGTAASSAVEIIMDNTGAGVTQTGAWTPSNGGNGDFYSTNYLHDGSAGKGSKSVRFTPSIPTAGSYEVFLWWAAYNNRATNVPVDVISAGGTSFLQINQKLTGGQWVSLGTYTFDAGTGGSVLISNTGTAAGTYVVADAVRFVSSETAMPSAAVPQNLGVNTGVTSLGLNAADFTKMQQAGIKYIRADLTWNGIETVKTIPPTYNWNSYKTLIANANSYGINIVWVVAYGNSLYGAAPIDTPAERQGYADFAAAAVAELNQPGMIWELWNEQNSDFWPGHDANQYMALIDATVPGMKAADPACTVISGGVIDLGWAQTLSWLDQCFQQGLLNKVDGLGVHLYGPSGQNRSPERVSKEIANLRGIMATYGVPADYPILNTEFGAQLNEYTGTAAEQETQKAQAYVRMYLLSLLNKLTFNSIYEWQWEGGNSPHALLNPNGTVRTSYTAVSVLTTQLAGYTFEKRVVLGSADDTYGLVFKNGANRKLVLWTGQGFAPAVPVSVSTVAASFATVDMLGNPGSVPVSGGKITLAPAGGPLYVSLGTATVQDTLPDLRYQAEDSEITGSTDAVSFFGEYFGSGGSALKLASNAVNDSLTYTLGVPQAGTYSVKVRFKSNTTRGQFQLAIDGVNHGTAFDEYAAAAGWVLVDLGTKVFSSAGNKVFKFTVSGKNAASSGHDFTLDYIELVPTTSPIQVHEAESLAQTSTDSTTLFAEFGAGNNNGLKLNSNAAGDSITFTVPVHQIGTYSLKVRVKKAATRGRCQLSIDGVNQGAVLEQYASVSSWEEVDLGTKTFSSTGNKTFKFTVTGKNPSGTGYDLAFDYIKLQ